VRGGGRGHRCDEEIGGKQPARNGGVEEGDAIQKHTLVCKGSEGEQPPSVAKRKEEKKEGDMGQNKKTPLLLHLT